MLVDEPDRIRKKKKVFVPDVESLMLVLGGEEKVEQAGAIVTQNCLQFMDTDSRVKTEIMFFLTQGMQDEIQFRKLKN